MSKRVCKQGRQTKLIAIKIYRGNGIDVIFFFFFTRVAKCFNLKFVGPVWNVQLTHEGNNSNRQIYIYTVELG